MINQLLKVNLEQVKVHITFAAGKYNVDPNYPLYKYSVYASYWIFAKNDRLTSLLLPVQSQDYVYKNE